LGAGGAAGGKCAGKREIRIMLVLASTPDFSTRKIPNFPYENTFKHQYEFYEKHHTDIILKSPTSSGKTDAFLFSFINDYLDAKSKGKRLKSLYLVPTRLLMYSQLENITSHLEEFKIPYKILESGYTYAQLFKYLLEDDFIISSPDIIFYILLRRKNTQHINFLYQEFIKSLHSIIFDELHLFDTFTLFNINNLIKIIKNIKIDTHIYLLSATIELKDVINPSEYVIIDGVSKTREIQVSGHELDYFNYKNVIDFLEKNNLTKDVIYVCNSVDRAIRLHKFFENSAILIGKTWYEEDDLSREEKIKENLDKCKKGALTFTTSVFRQGIDIAVKTLITEEPPSLQDSIQTFGRCGRRENSTFIMLTNRSPLLMELNSKTSISRKQFEELLSKYFAPHEYENLKKMMNAMWYKLYNTTRLKEYVEFLLTDVMKNDFEEFKEYLPDLSFREPVPAVQYDDLAINLFEILQFKDAHKNIYPSNDSFMVGELKDRGRFIRREYKKASKRDFPTFTLIESKRFKETEYYNLTLRLRDIKFKVNAKVGKLGDFPFTFVDPHKLIPIQKSFELKTFFE